MVQPVSTTDIGIFIFHSYVRLVTLDKLVFGAIIIRSEEMRDTINTHVIAGDLSVALQKPMCPYCGIAVYLIISLITNSIKWHQFPWHRVDFDALIPTSNCCIL